MHLADIHARTNLPLARLRYVLDNEIVPGLEHASEGRGTARDFSDPEAFVIALAATLFENGQASAFVRAFIKQMVEQNLAPRFATLPAARDPDVYQVAGQFRARFLKGGVPATPWFDASAKAPTDASYRPLAYLSVDLSELRRRLFTPIP